MANIRTVARNGSHDIYLVNGQLAMAEGIEAYRQIIEAAILTQRGELQLDIDRGIPYFESVFDKPHYVYLWEASVRETINGFSFVKSVDSFTYDIDYKTHKLNYRIEVTTDIGSLALSSENI